MGTIEGKRGTTRCRLMKADPAESSRRTGDRKLAISGCGAQILLKEPTPHVMRRLLFYNQRTLPYGGGARVC